MRFSTGGGRGTSRAPGALRLILALFSISHAATALDPDRPPTQYVHRLWLTDDGLPQNTVHAIVQTHDGYLWLGTQDGLARFDGVAFTVFDKSNTNELASNYVTTLYEDPAIGSWPFIRTRRAYSGSAPRAAVSCASGMGSS